MRLHTPAAAATAVALLTALLLPAAAGAQDTPPHSHSPATVTSPDGVTIDIEVYKPGTATADAPVPILLQGPGWSGTKTASDGAFSEYLDAGYGVVSITPRGFGDSGGEVTVMDPDFEGQDYIAVVDHIVEELDWVATVQRDVIDASGATTTITDPLLGAIGGSYGGGYQFLVALNELATRGHTRMDALSPQITWHDLNDSLAPSGVPRSAWLALLYAVGARDVAPYITEGFVYGVATGNYPDGTVPVVTDLEAEFATHGPAGFLAQGIQLDIPVLLRQGFSDTLFNFNQAWHNWSQLLTEEARAASTLIGYNGGHVLPAVLPQGVAEGSDACVDDHTATEIAFFDAVFAGEDTRVLGAPLQYTTAQGTCLQLEEVEVVTETRGLAGFDPTGATGVEALSPVTAGPPQFIEIAGTAGLTVAGVPTMTADVTGLGVDARAFVGLAVGTSPQDARIIQGNLLPLRTTGGVAQLDDLEVELPGMAAELAEGERLFLAITPIQDTYFGHGSRTPGALTLSEVRVHLPVVRPAERRSSRSVTAGAADRRLPVGGDGSPDRGLWDWAGPDARRAAAPWGRPLASGVRWS